MDYDALDRLIRVRELNAAGGGGEQVTGFRYDAAGNVYRVIDPRMHVTTYDYDGASRLRFVTRPLTQVVEYRYDGRGRLARLINARRQVVDYAYEEWGPLKQVEHFLNETGANGDSNRQRAVEYTYDDSGNLLTVADSAITGMPHSFPGVVVYEAVSPGSGDAYDSRDRLRRLEVHYPGLGVKTLTHSYDRFGNRSGLELAADGQTLPHNWVYDEATTDAFDRLKRAVLPGPGAGELLQFSYVAAALGWEELDTLAWPSGLVTDLEYENHGPIKRITVGPSALDVLDYEEGRDAVDRITEIEHSYANATRTYQFAYDPSGRLTSANYLNLPGLAPESFEYDPTSNRELPGNAAAYEYSDNDELEASPTTPRLCYDDDGNVKEKRTTGPCYDPAPVESFTWDTVSQLREWTGPSQPASYVYDPFGRRVKKTSSAGTTWYLWDGDQLLAEYDGAGTRQVRYAYAGGGFAPVQVAFGGPGSEAIYDVHTDHLDTPRMLTDASGGVVWRAAYEAFGRAHLDSGNTLAEDFNIRFPGQYYDEETETAGVGSGRHDNRFRTYDPAIGRYISADPIGQAGGINVFLYALSNPVGLIDPFGLIDVEKGMGRATANTLRGIGLSVPGTNAEIEAQAAAALNQQFPGEFNEGEAGTAAGPLREELGLLEAGRLGKTAVDLNDVIEEAGGVPTADQMKELERLEQRIDQIVRDLVRRAMEREGLTPEQKAALQKCEGLLSGLGK